MELEEVELVALYALVKQNRQPSAQLKRQLLEKLKAMLEELWEKENQ